jgi:hypothetical protein
MTRARGTENRHDLPRDPAAVLRLCRAFTRELGKVQAQGPVYRAIDATSAKIDGLAEWLTGESGYFSKGGMSHTAQPQVLEKWRRWDAIERGEEPWPRD